MEKFKSGVFLVIMMVSMSVGVMASITLIAVDELAVLPILAQIVLSGLATVVLLGIASFPMAIKLRAIAEALTAINKGKHAATIAELPAGFLRTLISETNKLVANQNDFQSMRGRLYQQISEVAAQEERNRLARDLHDSIKQQVFSMSVSAAAAHAHLDKNPIAAREALLDVRQSAQEAMVEMRVLLQQLAPAPLEQLGLIESIRQQMEAISYRTGASIETDFDKLPADEHLPIGAQETLFRITQEALSNIARHARAKRISLSLKYQGNDTLCLTIIDDGQGFDVDSAKRGMGLNNMERRVADLDGDIKLTSDIGTGTTLTASFPLALDGAIENQIEERATHKKQAEGVYHAYIGFAVMLAGIAFGMTLSIRAYVHDRPVFLTLIMALIGAMSAIGAVYFWRNYRKRRGDMNAIVPENDPAWELVKQHQNECHWIVWFALAFVIPGSFVGIEGYLWLPVAIGIVLLILVEWSMLNIIRYGHRYLKKLLDIELEEAMKDYRIKLTAGIVSTVLVAVTVFLPGTSTGFYLLPLTTDQWDSNFFTMMVLIFTSYHAYSLGLYSYWNNRLTIDDKDEQ